MTARAGDGDDESVLAFVARWRLALVALALAVPPGALGQEPQSHRAAAEAAERVGRFRAAARDYAAAFDEERAPELLYRLGICRRRLKQYRPARNAFRSYLRLAPAGALKDDAERQLAQLDVLLDEERRSPDEGSPLPKPKRPKRAPPPLVQAQPAAPAPEQPKPEPQVAPPVATEAPPATLAPAPPSPPAVAVEQKPLTLALAAPPPATIDAALVAPPVRARSPAPYVAASGAVVAAAAGAAFWWDGARVARDLDARFAAGSLTPADASRYGRAHAESVAGRVLVGAAILAAGAAVLLWQ